MVTVLYSPGYVQPPQQYQQLYGQIKHKPAVVPLTNAVLNPGAVMVIAPDTVLTCLTVLGSHWLLLGLKVITFKEIQINVCINNCTEGNSFVTRGSRQTWFKQDWSVLCNELWLLVWKKRVAVVHEPGIKRWRHFWCCRPLLSHTTRCPSGQCLRQCYSAAPLSTLCPPCLPSVKSQSHWTTERQEKKLHAKQNINLTLTFDM